MSGDVLAWCSQLLSHRELKEQLKEIDKKLLVKTKCQELLQGKKGERARQKRFPGLRDGEVFTVEEAREVYTQGHNEVGQCL